MNLVSIVNGKRNLGFEAGRRLESLPGAYRPCELIKALETVYDFDAYAVSYVVVGAARHCRINKGGLEAFPERVECSVMFADVDLKEPGRKGKATWTVERLKQVQEQHAGLDILRTTGMYHTKNGYRLVQPLTRALPPVEFEVRLGAWLRALQRVGIQIDEAAKDWTRHFRMVHVTRDDGVYRAPHRAFHNMVPIDPDSLELDTLLAARSHPSSQAPGAVVGDVQAAPEPVTWADSIPSDWREHVEHIAAAVGEVDGEWHSLFLALAGTLARSRVPAGQVPSLVRAISAATGADTKTDEREHQARYTIDRLRRGALMTTASLISSTVAQMHQEACHPRHQRAYEAARAHHTVLALHVDLASALSAMRDATPETYGTREAVTRALLLEHRVHKSQVWTHALFAAYYPMLRRLRRRVVCSWSSADIDQVILVAFSEALDQVDVTDSCPCSLMLRQRTARLVFRRLRQEWDDQRIGVVDGDWMDVQSTFAIAGEPDHRAEDGFILDEVLREAGASADVLRATVCGEESLREYVERTVLGDEEARRCAYERLRFQRARALEKLKRSKLLRAVVAA